MGRKKRYTAADVIGALRHTGGMVYLAADELGCTHTTIYNYMNRYPSVKTEFEKLRGKLLDIAELKLKDAILAGEHWAVAFALKTIGKHRGYVEKQALDVRISEGELNDTIEQELARLARTKETTTAPTAGADADAAD